MMCCQQKNTQNYDLYKTGDVDSSKYSKEMTDMEELKTDWSDEQILFFDTSVHRRIGCFIAAVGLCWSIIIMTFYIWTFPPRNRNPKASFSVKTFQVTKDKGRSRPTDSCCRFLPNNLLNYVKGIILRLNSVEMIFIKYNVRVRVNVRVTFLFNSCPCP